jgi:hypothetical protein
MDLFIQNNKNFLNEIGTIIPKPGNQKFDIIFDYSSKRNFRMVSISRDDSRGLLFEVKFTSGEIHHYFSEKSILNALKNMSDGNYEHDEEYLENLQYYLREEIHRQIVAREEIHRQIVAREEIYRQIIAL